MNASGSRGCQTLSHRRIRRAEFYPFSGELHDLVAVIDDVGERRLAAECDEIFDVQRIVRPDRAIERHHTAEAVRERGDRTPFGAPIAAKSIHPFAQSPLKRRARALIDKYIA